MVNWLRILPVAITVAAVVQLASGTVISTPASQAIRTVASQLQRFSKANGGANAIHLHELFNESNRISFETMLNGKIEDRFTLYGDTGPTDPALGKIVAITKGRVSEDRREGTFGRYAVFRKGADWSSRWLGEKEAEALFAANGMVLPLGEVWKQPDTKGWDGFPFPEPPPEKRETGTTLPQATSQNPQPTVLPAVPSPSASDAPRPAASEARRELIDALWWMAAIILFGGMGLGLWHYRWRAR